MGNAKNINVPIGVDGGGEELTNSQEGGGFQESIRLDLVDLCARRGRGDP